MNTEWVFYVTAICVGAVMGSFLNVVIHRGPVLWKLIDAPDRGNLAFPRSSCPTCGAVIRIWHLIPLVSYAMLRGKCAACGARISPRYPLVELVGVVSALVALAVFGLTFSALFAFVFFLFLLALGVIDFETGFLPDALTIPLLVLGICANSFGLFNATPGAAVLGAVIGYVAFRLIDIIFLRLRDVEGLGQGDAKLLAAIGAWLGWTALPPVVFLAAITALIGVGAASLRGVKIKQDTPIPFGPALAAAGALAMAAHGLRLPFFV
ncbi:prepilin peptidase [Hyphococcus sp.]|uniref:prepilin peptidase n=1 Tax=Hyphococcus sp. TaxID=2038636 RepID=UPI002086523F|nr:MAG: type 4 prepilin-like proteins leader peptide-processing enzyme [Marinicaulis sp.]